MSFWTKKQHLKSFLINTGEDYRPDSGLLFSWADFLEDTHTLLLSAKIPNLKAGENITIRKGRFHLDSSVDFLEGKISRRNKDLLRSTVSAFSFGLFESSTTTKARDVYRAPEIEHAPGIQSCTYELALLSLAVLGFVNWKYQSEIHQVVDNHSVDHLSLPSEKLGRVLLALLNPDPLKRRIDLVSLAEEIRIWAEHLGIQDGNQRGKLLNGLRNQLYQFNRNNRLFHYPINKGLCLSTENPPFLQNPMKLEILEMDQKSESLFTRIRRAHNRDSSEKGDSGLSWAYLKLKWRNPLKEEDMLDSPLLFCPLELEYDFNYKKAQFQPQEDFWLVNPLIRILLMEKFQLGLPESVKDREEDLVAFREFVLQQIARLPQQEESQIVDDGLVLDLFSHQKAVLAEDYADLKRNEHELVDALLGLTSYDFEARSGAVNRWDKQLVLPCDPDQEKVIERVQSGESIVVEGPPGTGKSQMTVNLIATALGQNKSVLFVSEKKAALEVVYQRLQSAGLGHLGLIMHNHRKEKKELIQRLRAAYDHYKQELARDMRIDLMLKRRAIEESYDFLKSYYEWLSGGERDFTLAQLFEEHREADFQKDLPNTEIPVYEWVNRHKEDLTTLSALLEERRFHPVYNQNNFSWLNPELSNDKDPVSVVFQLINTLEKDVPELDSILKNSRLNCLKEKSIAELSQILSSVNSFRAMARESRMRMLFSNSGLASDFARLNRKFAKLNRKLARLKERSDNQNEIDTLEEELAEVRDDFAVRLGIEKAEVEIEQIELQRDLYRRLLTHLPDFTEELEKKRDPDGELLEILAIEPLFRRVQQALVRLFVQPSALYPNEIIRRLNSLREYDQLADSIDLLGLVNRLDAYLRKFLLSTDLPPLDIVNFSREKEIREAMAKHREFSALQHGELEASFGDLEVAYSDWLNANAAYLNDETNRRLAEAELLCQTPARHLTEEQKAQKWLLRKGFRILQNEFSKSRAHKDFRTLWNDSSGSSIKTFTRFLLGSPASLAEVLKCEKNSFDLIIFDESSQIPLEDALPLIYRAEQLVLFGDSQQLAPTRFFKSRTFDAVTEGDLSFNSLFQAARASLPSESITWHYRSKDKRLIEFSNEAFYKGELKLIPNAHSTLESPISLHYCEKGFFKEGVNVPEADALVDSLEKLLQSADKQSIGIIALSANQAELIQQLLDERLASRPDLMRMMAKLEEPLFVRNLERVQGDERDTILISLAYSGGDDGANRLNFGPIMHEGGYRRLNVLLSRARTTLHLFYSFEPGMLSEVQNEQLDYLYHYFQYVECLQTGDQAGFQAIVKQLNPLRRIQIQEEVTTNTRLEMLISLAPGISFESLNLLPGAFHYLLKGDEIEQPALVVIEEGNGVNLWDRLYLEVWLLKRRGFKLFYLSPRDFYPNATQIRKAFNQFLKEVKRG